MAEKVERRYKDSGKICQALEPFHVREVAKMLCKQVQEELRYLES